MYPKMGKAHGIFIEKHLAEKLRKISYVEKRTMFCYMLLKNV